jgi:uncharacterized cupredoxin-like copper-binding protein
MKAVALVACCAAACGGAIGDGGRHPDAHGPHRVPAERPVLGLQPGESMTFEVEIDGILAGEAELAVGLPGVIDGRRAILVRSRIASAGALALVKKVSDEATTVIATDTATPISMTSDVTMGGVDYHADVAFKGPIIEATSTRSDAKGVQHDRFAFGATVAHDTHSAMASLRGWDPAPGATKTMYVMGGKRIWKAELTFHGRDTIGTQLGNRAAVRIDGSAWRAHNDLSVDAGKPAREFSVWLSDDADRVPLEVIAKTELGDLVIELTDYRRP